MKKSELLLQSGIGLLLMTCTFPQSGVAQATYPELTNAVFQPAPSDRDQNELGEVIGIGAPGALDEIARRLAKRALNAQNINFAQIGESASQSIQNGASPTSAGATSLVSKAVTSVLGIAEEAGAINTSTSGSTTTLTANIPQLFNLMGMGKRCYLISDSCSFGGVLVRGASASVSLNSSSSTAPATSGLSSSALAALSGTANPVFSGFTLQESFHGRKNGNLTGTEFQGALDKMNAAPKTAYLAAFVAAGDAIHTQAAYPKALDDCVASLRNPDATGARLADLADLCIDSFADVAEAVPGITATLAKYISSEEVYDVARDAALSALFYRNNYSIEYDYSNVLNQPTQSTYKLIYGYQSKSGVFQATANGSATLYNSLEGSSVSRLRSAQGAAQLDFKPSLKTTLQYALSAGYYFQDMLADGLLTLPSTAFAPGTTVPLPGNASVLLNTTGPIQVGQAKITLSLKGTNVSIPIAFTGASRTDLITANTRFGGNFGISYDFSSLLSSK